MNAIPFSNSAWSRPLGGIAALTFVVMAMGPVGGEPPPGNEKAGEVAKERELVEVQIPPLSKGAATVAFQHDSFTFVRIKYSSKGRRALWGVDYPEADRNFSARLEKVTGLKANKDGRVLELTDPNLKKYPFLYLSEGGAIALEPAEAKSLREYLLGGGFLMVDDFWGDLEWESLQAEIRKVFPKRKPVELPLTHPIFRSYYDIREKPQVPAIAVALQGRAKRIAHEPLKPGTKGAQYWGLKDEKGRLMAILCQNTDLADGWEREGASDYYDREFVYPRAYPMGINIVVYALKK